jgi:hypothetical protein
VKKILTTMAIVAAAVISIGVAAPAASPATTKVAASTSSQMNDTWAGYVAAYHGPYTQVWASWVQPAVTGTHLWSPIPNSTVIWVGIGGLGGSIEGGPNIDDGGVRAPVQVGTTMDTNGYYRAWWVTPDSTNANAPGNVISDDQGKPYPVSPGDHLTAEVDYTHGSYHMWIMDSQADGQFWSWSYPGNINGNWPRNTAEIIVENPAWTLLGIPTGLAGLAPFDTVQFTVHTLGPCYKFETPNMSVSDPSANHLNFTVHYHK